MVNVRPIYDKPSHCRDDFELFFGVVVHVLVVADYMFTYTFHYASVLLSRFHLSPFRVNGESPSPFTHMLTDRHAKGTCNRWIYCTLYIGNIMLAVYPAVVRMLCAITCSHTLYVARGCTHYILLYPHVLMIFGMPSRTYVAHHHVVCSSGHKK